MSTLGAEYNITQTFIIEPVEGVPVFSACTGIYSNILSSCSGNTNIFLGEGVISFDGNIYTNDNLTASTIHTSAIYSAGTNVIDIINLKTLSGGTFDSNSNVLTLGQSDGTTISVSGFKDYYTTGTTLIGHTVYFNRNDTLSAYTLNLSSFSADTYVTGVTFTNNDLIITRNDGVHLNTFINTFTGLTINGTLSVSHIIANSISANTISATTFYGDGSNLTGLSTKDTYVTGGTYNSGTATFTNNTGGTFNVTGFYTGYTAPIDIRVTGGTYNAGTAVFTNNTGGTFSVTGFNTNTATSFTGGTVTGDTLFTNGVSANTISATTYLNTPYWTSGSTGNYSIKTKNDSSVDAANNYAVAEGYATTANGVASHSEGGQSTAIGDYAHAEGYLTTASAPHAHAEGNVTIAAGDGSHAEGQSTAANGQASHAEGYYTLASGFAAHSEGGGTKANGNYSHAEGNTTIASGDYTHSGGYNSMASGTYSFVHGSNSIASGTNAVVLGANITGTTDNTVYVPYMNIKYLSGGTSINNLGIDANGYVVVGSAGTLFTGGTVTGATYFNNGLSANTFSATTYLGLPNDIRVTGGTYSNGTAVFTNNTGGTFSVNGFSTPFTGGTVNGATIFTNGLSANTISATTYLNLPVDVRVTGGTYSSGTSTFTNNTGGTFSVSGYPQGITSTGLYSFGGLSLSGSSTFNVGPAYGYIIDDTVNYSNPTIIKVAYTGQTNIQSLYFSSATETFLLLTSGGTIFQQTSIPTPQQRKQNIFLGKLGHPGKSTILNVFNTPDIILTPLSQLRDIWSPINLINGGVYPSANTGLTINTSAGYVYGLGINFVNNVYDPNRLSVAGTNPTTFAYRTQTGGTLSNTSTIDPSHYDVGGVVTSIGGGTNASTNQRIYLVENGAFRIQYGQTVYSNLSAAIAGVQSESFILEPNFGNIGILIGILSVVKNATDLTNSSKAQFLLVSKFGEAFGAAGGLSTTTLQQAYNNSTSPEIVINATLDGLSIQNGTGNSDSSTDLIEGQNTAGAITSLIRADGYISGTTFQSNGFLANANGLTATTISATTYLNLPTDIRVTGGTYSSGTATFTNNTGGTFSVTGFSTGGGSTFTGGTVNGATIFTNGLTANTISATTYLNLPVTADSFTTAFTYSNNVFTIGRNQGLSALTATINTVTGFTINGALTVTGASALNGTISSTSLTGTTDRLVEANSGGTVTSSKQIITAYLTSGGTIANLLETTSNWDIDGNYTGSTITGTYQGQKHYNPNYFFEAVADNVFIRLIRG